jgi:acetyl-CoA carboxylase carboxyltransferase component
VTDASPPHPRSAARERIEALSDPGTFFELDAIPGRPDDGVVAGVATIDGRDVALYAAGDAGAAAARIVKVRDLALRSRIPVIGLEDCGAPPGGDLPALAGRADVLQRMVRASGVIPQLAVAAGPHPGPAATLADFVLTVAGTGCQAHFTAGDEAGCWLDVRRLLSYLPANNGESPPFGATDDPGDRVEPELQALAGTAAPFDVDDVIARVLDDGGFLEAQAGVALNLVAGFGRLGGHAVGVVANQPATQSGAIDAAAEAKAARFVRTCDAFNVPLVTLVDTSGLGPDGHGTRLAYAYAEATVPKLTVILRRAPGDAYGVMAPRPLGADLVLAWPGAEIAGADVYAAAERGHVDDVIEPRETRRALVRGLELCLRKDVDRPARKHGNIPL